MAVTKSIMLVLFLYLLNPLAGAGMENPIEARDLVVNELLKGDTAEKRVFVHPGLLQAGTPVSTWHGEALTTPAEGFVVFIDDMAFANFEHPCRYVFVEAATGDLTVYDARTPPNTMTSWREMETEAYRKLMSARNVRARRSEVKATPRKTPRGGEYYAVLMSGGHDIGNNHVRYWNDLSNIYITLVDVYGYKDENIIVLCSDGLNPAVDQSNGLNSDPDLDGDGDDDIMYSCLLSNIQLVFNQLATTLTPDDQLFVFSTDHGSSGGGWSVYLNLWNQEQLTDAQLKGMFDALPTLDIITTMEQCYSGGFEDDLDAAGRVFSSAAAFDEVSWAMPPNYVYDTYVFFWTAAVKGEDAFGNPCNADVNGDNIISMYEAFLYAEANDISDETPQYNSNPTTLGDNLFLGPGPTLVFKFPVGLPEGICMPGVEEKLELTIQSGLENYVPGTAEFCCRFDPGDPYTTVSLTPVGGDQFEVTLPAAMPGDLPQFYFQAQGDGGTTIHSPYNAPSEVYSFVPGISWVMMEDDCEVNNGWTIESVNLQTGEFELADPLPTDAQPGDDHSPVGTRCFVTDGRGGSIGDYDVDGGPTRLISPSYDLSSGDAVLKYWVWHHDSDGGKPLKIDITGGMLWVTAENVSATGGWKQIELRVSDYINPTGAVKVRFNSSDQPNSAIVETCVDDFTMERLVTEEATLWADSYSIPAVAGAVIDFSLDAGPACAARSYLVLGSLSGPYPGYPLPGGEVLPLNWDLFTDLTLSFVNTPVCDKFMGVLDGSGQAEATLNTFGPLDPAVIGLEAHFAYLLGNPFDFVSNPIPVSFE